MLDEHFVILGALFSLYGSSRYAVATVRGNTRPNRVTWLLWALAPMIGFLAQLDEQVGLPAVLTLSVGLGPAIVFAASFVNRSAFWRISAFDIGCGLVSVAALAVWLTLDHPTAAIVFAVLADLTAGIPTLVKAWRAPETEHGSAFLFAAANGAVALLTIDHWNVATWAFPVYIVTIGVTLTAVVALRGRSTAGQSDHDALGIGDVRDDEPVRRGDRA